MQWTTYEKRFFIKQKAIFKVLFFVFFVHEVYFLKQLLGYICELNLQLFFKKTPFWLWFLFCCFVLPTNSTISVCK